MKVSIEFESMREFVRYRELHSRMTNTLEPARWPQWLKELDLAIECVNNNPGTCLTYGIKSPIVEITFNPVLSGEAS